jgi:quinol monooxygenase YgiN
MAFIQLIEIATSRPDEVEALVAEWRKQTLGRRTAQRGTFTQDRERPNTYLQIVEFPSYEDAMANSDLPETAAFAQRLGELCDGPMLFRNLDVRSVEEM